MHKTATLTWIILITLTIASALISKLDGAYIATIILLLAILKFLGIAFQFMELKKAHTFWKGMIIVFLVIFVSIILIVL